MTKQLIDRQTVEKYFESYKSKGGTVVELEDQIICYGACLKTMVIKKYEDKKRDDIYHYSLTSKMPKKIMNLLGISDKVVTICYNQRKEWTSRDKAKQFFLDCMKNSEGAERDRYTNVWIKLEDGLDECSDED